MSVAVNSYYEDSVTVPWVPCPSLSEDREVDVCVIGGGISGCSAALHLAHEGYRVALLEGKTIGYGASGRSGGQILPGLGTDLAVIERQLGLDAARAIWTMSLEAVELVQSLIRQYSIPCDFRSGYLHVALKARHVEELKGWQATMASRYGYEGLEWLDASALRERVVTDAYLGGLSEPGAGHLHPLNYTLGLARAASDAGVDIFEHSPATAITQGEPCRVTTPSGTIRAQKVVLTTNAYHQGLVPPLASKLMPVANYIIATEPLSDEQVARVLPFNEAVSDANFVLDYYRLSGDQRLLYGGQVSYNGREPPGLLQRMQDKMTWLFPVLEGISIDYRWGGDVAITRNRAPHLGRHGEHLYYADGYSGHGLALAGLAGKLLCEAIAGKPRRFDHFAALKHRSFPGGQRLRTPLLVLATSFFKLKDRL
ncbi:NAD(P)/FAD-dependent oxidoreductase [Larsenimonas rhizosphaerae]|uniref:FAD-binding oxidoreductase n=1 Tax=Larsenimonas rhizosphaerae TaxID=2944682 RepID=A0AA41ZH73_9GAMM|nr:FAD-binding oxidoreductase [Larsenimonas rhizosphaerae]MCX2523818.1 FAD-binding oxidoreductase [Larsenimonas rhizosphaerae]